MMAKKQKTIMEEFEIDELAGVDFPAMEGAKAVLFKRQEPEDIEKNDPSEFSMPMLSDGKKGHQHLLDGSVKVGRTTFDVSSGEEFSHSHATVMLPDGSIKILMAEGHDHEAIELGKRNISISGGDVAQGGQSSKERSMTNEATKKTTAEDEAKAVEKRLEKLESELEFAKKYGELSDAEKSFYEKLDDDGKKEFVSKDEGTRRREIEKASEANSVTYTSDSGEEFRKNDDPRLVRLAKDADEERRIAKSERKQRLDVELSKRAEEELSNVGGTVEGKKALLKAVDGITDEKTRGEATSTLKAANDAMKGLFKAVGHQNAGSEDGDPYAELEALAKSYAKDNSVDIVKARSLVLDTEEGAEIYLKMTGRNA